MKRSLGQVGVGLAAALMVVGTTTSASGQGQEYVVDSRVISDTVSEPAFVSDSYVGDMSIGSSGACSGNGECSGGASSGGGLFSGDGLFGRNRISGGPVNRRYGQPDLFYNYYTQGYYNRANAQMYVSPLPVPPHVGHTFFTYQPFYPEEMLYWHKNRFHKYYDDGRGMNRTRAVYYSPPIRQAASNLYWNYLRLPR